MELHNLPLVGPIIKFLESEDIDYGVVVFLLGIVIIYTVFSYVGISQSKVVSFLFATAPVWLPMMSFFIFFHTYMNMLGAKFRITSGRTVFEIILPPEVFKSPEAMENVFTQIYNAANPDNLMETYIDGKRPLPYTFELVSRGGDVHFYITVPNKFTKALQANMYAQYPGVELVKQEVDYTAEIPSNLKGYSFMSFHVLKKDAQEFPIKTYIDFGLDKLPKEEEKLDPMTPMLEVLASIEPHQQLWVQFICIAHRKKGFKLGQLRSAGTWEKGVHEKIDELMGRDSKTKAGPAELEGMPRLTPGERDTIEAMERNAGKVAFEFASRVVYLSSKSERDYDGGLFARVARMVSQTEIKGRNGLGIQWRTDFNYKFFSDPFGKKVPALKHHEIIEYKKRVLYPKAGHVHFKIMTAEEMATIFHLPGAVALTPTLNRVTSTRSEAPTNLPTGNPPTF